MDGCCFRHRKWCRRLSFSTEQQKKIQSCGIYGNIFFLRNIWSITFKECADFSSCSGCVRNKSESLHRKLLWMEDWSGWEKNKSCTSHMGIVCRHSKDWTHLLYPRVLDADWWTRFSIHSGVSDNEIPFFPCSFVFDAFQSVCLFQRLWAGSEV